MADQPDYKSILTRLYQQYNPEKVADVEFLLKKFEGREEEMIAKIREKYKDVTPIPLDPQETTPIPSEVVAPPEGVAPKNRTQSPTPPPPPPAAMTSPPRRSRKRIVLALGTVVLAVGAFVTYYFFGDQLNFGGEAERERLYVVADTVFTHTECDLGMETRLLPLPYGKGLEVYTMDENCITTELDGKTHFVPRKYLGTSQEFSEIDAIYGNEASRTLFDNSYEKRALRNYFNRTQIMGDIPMEKQKELYGEVRQREVWQVYGEDAESELNAVVKGGFSNDDETEVEAETHKPEDMAVIISDRDNRDRRKLLLFAFDEEKVESLVDEMDLSNYPGYLIRPVDYSEELFLFGTPYLKLDAGEDSEDVKLGLLLQRPGRDQTQYLIEIEAGELLLNSLDKGFFELYKKDPIYQP